MKVKVFNRLAFKLIIAISILLLSALSVYTFYTVRLLKHDMTNIIHARSNDISEVIRKSTRYSMLLNRYDDVYEIMRTIGTESGVEKIRLYSKTGEIMFSTDSIETGTKANLKAEACNVCHGEATLTSNVPTQNKMRIYVNPDGHQVLGVISPIQNEPDCYNADCHAHPKEKEVLGVLDVVLSMRDLERVVETSQNNIIVSSIIITFFIAGFCGLFIALWVNIPVRRINAGIKEIANGNLDFTIEVKSHDELSKMAKQFNIMSVNLKKAYSEIRDWNEKLNEKVNSKTEELKNIYSQVIQIEKLASLGKLSATVAHELNNPLEGILTYSKLISKKLQKVQKENEFESLLEHLTLISDESMRCGRIVKDLLLFSHKGDKEYVDENFKNIINRSVALINHHLEIHNVRLYKKYPEEKIYINCDPQKIQQALMSLFINAIEAMPEGGDINVDLNRDSDKVYLRIKDQGHGIAERDLAHIFEPFYTTKEASKGTGLGLSVVYGIIGQHKGFIEVESTSSEGTTFKITLPISNL